jgi:ATP-dependent RNA helicase DDX35
MSTIVACLSAAPHGVFVMAAAAGGPGALDRAKARFAAAEGDLVTLLNVWRAWQENGRSSRWCASNCLNPHALTKAAEVRAALLAACRRMGLPQPESCDGDLDILRRALLAVGVGV